MGKGLLKSKTVLFNLLTAALSVGIYLQGSEILVDHPKAVAGIGMAVGIINIILRLMTKEPITSIK